MSRLDEIAQRYAELDCNDTGKEGRRARAIFEDHAPADIRDLLEVARWAMRYRRSVIDGDEDYAAWDHLGSALDMLEEVSGG